MLCSSLPWHGLQLNRNAATGSLQHVWPSVRCDNVVLTVVLSSRGDACALLDFYSQYNQQACFPLSPPQVWSQTAALRVVNPSLIHQIQVHFIQMAQTRRMTSTPFRMISQIFHRLSCLWVKEQTRSLSPPVMKQMMK